MPRALIDAPASGRPVIAANAPGGRVARRTSAAASTGTLAGDRRLGAPDAIGPRFSVAAGPPESAVDLFWLPLGAGGQSVRLNGRAFEAVASRIERRPACDLYHSAIEVRIDATRFVIEQAPVCDEPGEHRGVVAEGPVGTRCAGRLRIFRYEIRRWQDGRIPDVGEAVGGPQRLTDDRGRARRVLDLVADVPTPVWGRDELKAGEMWNSNSVIAWLLTRSGIDAESIRPPRAGRAPGWRAGIVVARRQELQGEPAPGAFVVPA